MEGLPHLSQHDLESELETLYGGKRHHHLFAFYGTGDEQVLRLKAGEVHVVPVRSELELRERLPEPGDSDARMAFLVPWSGDIPIDIAGRFVLNGRVRRIGKSARLQHLFGVGAVDDEILAQPLVEYLLRPGNAARYPVGDSRLTVDAMWSAWLARDFGVETQGGLALDTLLGWAALDQRGPRFVEAMQVPSAAGLREALLGHLHDRLGPTGPVVWRAWEEGKGRVALELAVLFEALAQSPLAAVAMWVKTKAREALAIGADGDPREVAAGLGREAAAALRYVDRSARAAEVRSIARAADDRVDDPEVRAALVESTRLPSAWALRLARIGEALERGAREPTPASVGEAAAALRGLEAHTFFKDEDNRHALTRAEMAVRLLAWLAARPDARIEPGATPYGDVEALGRWYAQEGGYVDRARRLARGSSDGPFGVGVQAVVHAADDARTVLDRRFAKALGAWVEAGQPSSQVLPIQDVARRVVSSFLDGNDERRLLVLLLDGMAWTQAVELLESLAGRAAPWGPLAWHATKDGRIGEGVYPVMLAGLPTVTEVSRSSFFAGKVMKAGARLDTSKDPELWAANPHVKKYAEGTDVPRLLLRNPGHTKAGAASQEALSLVADSGRRVVALVLNAIDDALKASHAVRHSWAADTIASLPDLLDKAREHGRAILLVSDHGHVPADCLSRVPGSTGGGGARWRPWPSPSAEVSENEVAIPAGAVYAPKGSAGIVMLADDASCYQGSTHAGEHGGATLAEVVAPCLLIGCEEAVWPAAGADPALHVRAPFVPGWWHFEVEEHVVPVEAEPPRIAPAKKAKPVDERQLGLPAVVDVPSRPASVPAPASAFGSSEVLAARVPSATARKEVVAAVEHLLARHGVMSGEAFAASMRVLSFRVGGLISKLQEVLNLDGYEVLRYDPTARQVHLDRDKLAQLFEVSL